MEIFNIDLSQLLSQKNEVENPIPAELSNPPLLVGIIQKENLLCDS